jgi:hypothetical protein
VISTPSTSLTPTTTTPTTTIICLLQENKLYWNHLRRNQNTWTISVLCRIISVKFLFHPSHKYVKFKLTLTCISFSAIKSYTNCFAYCKRIRMKTSNDDDDQ